MATLSNQVDLKMSEQKTIILTKISEKRDQFERAYASQVDTDIKQLKSIGELQHNYQTMTTKVMQQRQQEFVQIEKQISETLRSSQVYEQEQACKQMLLQQINTLKN